MGGVPDQSAHGDVARSDPSGPLSKELRRLGDRLLAKADEQRNNTSAITNAERHLLERLETYARLLDA